MAEMSFDDLVRAYPKLGDADRRAREASRRHREAQPEHLAGRMGNEAYIAIRREYDAANRDYDVAEREALQAAKRAQRDERRAKLAQRDVARHRQDRLQRGGQLELFNPHAAMPRTERDEIIVAIATGTLSSLIGSLAYRALGLEGTGATLADQLTAGQRS